MLARLPLDQASQAILVTSSSPPSSQYSRCAVTLLCVLILNQVILLETHLYPNPHFLHYPRSTSVILSSNLTPPCVSQPSPPPLLRPVPPLLLRPRAPWALRLAPSSPLGAARRRPTMRPTSTPSRAIPALLSFVVTLLRTAILQRTFCPLLRTRASRSCSVSGVYSRRTYEVWQPRD